VPLGVTDPDEQERYRRDSSQYGSMPRSISEGSAAASVSSPGLQHACGTLSVFIDSMHIINGRFSVLRYVCSISQDTVGLLWG